MHNLLGIVCFIDSNEAFSVGNFDRFTRRGKGGGGGTIHSFHLSCLIPKILGVSYCCYRFFNQRAGPDIRLLTWSLLASPPRSAFRTSGLRQNACGVQNSLSAIVI